MQAEGPGNGFSSFMGYLSICFWLFAQFPQVMENFRRGSAASLSPLFILNWLLGDATNLAGSILTNQLPFQIYLAGYFVAVDLILYFQWLYYEWYRPRHKPRFHRVQSDFFHALSPGGNTTVPDSHRQYLENADVEDTGLSDILRAASKSHESMTLHERYSKVSGKREGRIEQDNRQPSASIGSDRDNANWDVHVAEEVAHLSPRSAQQSDARRSRSSFGVNRFAALLVFASVCFARRSATGITGSIQSEDTESTDASAQFGFFISWLCCLLYLSSRMPQILLNFRRKSVKGLAINMFTFAAMGNLTYSWSIFAAASSIPADDMRARYLWKSLPFLLGSVGTLSSDLTIFAQYVWYSKA